MPVHSACHEKTDSVGLEAGLNNTSVERVMKKESRHNRVTCDVVKAFLSQSMGALRPTRPL